MGSRQMLYVRSLELQGKQQQTERKRRKISKKIKRNSFGVIISRLSICYLAILVSKYIRNILNFFLLNGPMKMGLQNISNLVFYHSTMSVFTKVFPPFTKRWRGISSKAIYIDGGIAVFRSFQLAKTAGILVRNYLVSAGFVTNVEKSNFNPK